jgi:recombination protein RecA
MTKEEKAQVNKEKLKALQLTMDKIEKSYGKGSIMRMGDGQLKIFRQFHQVL